MSGANSPRSDYGSEPSSKREIEKELRQKTFKLKSDVEDFAETLIDAKPDHWFSNPCGWMLGPGEKRSAEVSDATAGNKKTLIGSLTGTSNAATLYKKRWFVLDETSKTFKYYTNEKTRVETGCIDMTTVIDIQACTDKDAPPFAIDLVGRGGRCSIAGVTYNDTIRWMYALEEVIKLIRPVTKVDPTISPNQRNSTNSSDPGSSSRRSGAGSPRNTGEESDDKRWFRYSYTFPEQGPLMLNVVGLTDQDSHGNVQSHWLLVTSFARFQDGKVGAAEKSNLIKVKDYIVGVNNVDLTALPYNEAMTAMRSAIFPKTVYFLRDLQNKQEVIFLECFIYAYYPSLNRRRKRYIELDSDNINFRKTAMGGTASVKRDSFFAIDQISYVTPITDLNAPEDSQYLLRITCNTGSVIQLVGNDDMTVGTSPMEIMDLFFHNVKDLQDWVKYLSTSSLRPRRIGGCAIGDIHVAPHETIQEDSSISNKKNSGELLGIRSYVSGEFAPREFSITEDGFLFWKRPMSKSNLKDNKFAMDKGRRMFLANSNTCLLRSIYAVEDPEAQENYKYQLMIQDISQMVWIGMKNEETLLKWVQKIKNTVEAAPEESRTNLMMPEIILPLGVVMSALADSQWEDEQGYEDSVASSGNHNISASHSSTNTGTDNDSSPAPATRNRTGSVFDFLTRGNNTAGNNNNSPNANNTNPAGSARMSLFGGGASNKKQGGADDGPRSRADSVAGRQQRAGSMFGLGGVSVGRMSMSLNLLAMNSGPVTAGAGGDDEVDDETVHGYLFYKHNSKVKKQFSRFWFSLRGYKLFYFENKIKPQEMACTLKTQVNAPQLGLTVPLGYVDMLEILEVREAMEASAPENSIELIAPNRTYLLTANDEANALRWLDALSDLLEMRKVTVQKESKSVLNDKSKGERINALKKSIIFAGGLSMKTTLSITTATTWKQKWFVIAKGALMMFDSEKDVFLTENKEIIAIPAIRMVETIDEPTANHHCAFSVSAYVPTGGNREGMKVFIFEAQTANLCKEWMNQLCMATGTLIMKPTGTNGMMKSIVNENLRHMKDQAIAKKNNTFVVQPKKINPGSAGDSYSGKSGTGSGHDSDYYGQTSHSALEDSKGGHGNSNSVTANKSEFFKGGAAASGGIHASAGGRGGAGRGRGNVLAGRGLNLTSGTGSTTGSLAGSKAGSQNNSAQVSPRAPTEEAEDVNSPRSQMSGESCDSFSPNFEISDKNGNNNIVEKLLDVTAKPQFQSAADEGDEIPVAKNSNSKDSTVSSDVIPEPLQDRQYV